MTKLFVIDASNYLFRSYFAIKGMTNKKGVATNALFGFIRSMQKLISDFNPSFMAIVFDSPDNKSSRTKIYKEYKGHRQKMPNDLYLQIALAKEYCTLKGLAIVEENGVEADDSMGSIAHWAQTKNFETYLCSSDKDLCQLVNSKTFVLNTFKDNLIMKKSEVIEKFGVKPEQIIDYLSIVGDTSDNIPGIASFGPKKAQTLLSSYASLKKIYENIETIDNEKMKQKLKEEQENAFISYKLATINCNVQIEKNQEFYRIKNKSPEDLTDFYREMNFNFFLKQMPTVENPKKKKSSIISDTNELSSLVQHLIKKKELILTALFDEGNILKVEPIALFLEGHYIPCGDEIPLTDLTKHLNTLFAKASLVSHDTKRLLHLLQNIGVSVKTIAFDTQIASYLLNSDKTSHPLDELSQEFAHKNIQTTADLLGKGRTKLTLTKLDEQKKSSFLQNQFEAIEILYPLFQKELKVRNLYKLYCQIELPLIQILFHMEREGIKLDIKKLNPLKKIVQKELEVLEATIHSLANKKFNCSSSKQLCQILFVDLGITPTGKKTKTGYSTNAEVLQTLSKKHPIFAPLIEFRTLNKLMTTYIEPLALQINSQTHRIHPTFKQAITQTGRLSCTDPNLQNIPIKSTLGKKVREAFVSKPGFSFISLDYSQIELRLVAHLSRDKTLLAAFKKGHDIHTQTAAIVYHCLEEQVTKTMRSSAKTINFGILYGQGPFGLAKELGVSTKEAGAFIKAYFEKFSGVKKFIDDCIQNVTRDGASYSIMMRERKIPQIHSQNHMLKSLAHRLAINSPIQGSQADIIKLAMIDIDYYLQNHKGATLLLQIHDELVFECKDSLTDSFSKKLKSLMQNVITLDIPLVVDCRVAKNLGDL